MAFRYDIFWEAGEQMRETGRTVNGAVGMRLRKIREMLEVRVCDMAGSLDLSEGYYRKLERGDHAIGLPILISLHRNYGIDLNYLITGRAREEDIARELVCGQPEEMFYLLHRLLDCCERTYMEQRREDRLDGDEEHY